MRNTIFRLIFIVSIFSFLSSPMAAEIKGKTPFTAKRPAVTRTPAKIHGVKEPGVPAKLPVIKKLVKELQINLIQKRKRLFLELERYANKVIIFTGKKELGKLKGGKCFDITKYLSKSEKGRLLFICHDRQGNKYSKEFNISKYAYLVHKKKPSPKKPVIITKKAKKQVPDKVIPLAAKKATKPAVFIKEKPKLSIEKIYLKDNKIRVVLKNKGGRLSVNDYRHGKVILRYGGKTRSWHLNKIDPEADLNKLNKNKARDFDTGLTLKTKQNVRVSLINVKGDKFKQVRLSPPETHFPGIAKGLKERIPTKLYGGGVGELAPPQTPSKEEAMTAVAMDLMATPHIRILSPGPGEKWYLGRTYQIKWQPGGPDGSVSGPYNVYLYKGSETTGAIYIGWTGNEYMTWTPLNIPAGGCYTIKVCGDGAESTRRFWILELPDYKTSDIIIYQKPRTKKEVDITLKAKIINVGGNADRDSYATLKVIGPGGVEVLNEPIHIKPILKNGHYEIEESYPVPGEGTYKNVLEVDVKNDVAESNEDNNEGFKYWTVVPLPDLQVYIRPSIPAVYIGKRRTITAHVKNVGETSSPPTKLRFYVKKHGTNSYQVRALEPGDTWHHTRRPKWSIQGNKRFSAQIDPEGSITEINENNNIIRGSVQVYASKVGKFDPSGIYRQDYPSMHVNAPDKVSQDEKALIRIYLTNAGQVITTSCRLKLEIWTRPHILLDDNTYDIPSLFPDETYEIWYRAAPYHTHIGYIATLEGTSTKERGVIRVQ